MGQLTVEIHTTFNCKMYFDYSPKALCNKYIAEFLFILCITNYIFSNSIIVFKNILNKQLAL